jgi:hypothetical protein
MEVGTKKSLYSSDGKYLKKIEPVLTVYELRSVLGKMPDDLPLSMTSKGIKLLWCNVGQQTEHLTIEEDDECFDDM